LNVFYSFTTFRIARHLCNDLETTHTEGMEGIVRTETLKEALRALSTEVVLDTSKPWLQQLF